MSHLDVVYGCVGLHSVAAGRDERLAELEQRLVAAEAAAAGAMRHAPDGTAATTSLSSSSSLAEVAALQSQVQQLKQEVLTARQRYLDLADILNVDGSAGTDSATAAVGSSTGLKVADVAQPKGLPSLMKRPQTRKGLYALQVLAVQGVVQGICMNAS